MNSVNLAYSAAPALTMNRQDRKVRFSTSGLSQDDAVPAAVFSDGNYVSKGKPSFLKDFELPPARTTTSASILKSINDHHAMDGKKLGASQPDSWDAFDAKMQKSQKTVPKVVQNQFLELSSSQNKSLNLADEDFSMTFQDAKHLIEQDENERLQFMNSNVTFSEGLDQVEVPSLMSVTSYFQQGSSFPVPYGNDSSIFLPDSVCENVSSRRNSQPLRAPQTVSLTRRNSTNSSKVDSLVRRSSSMREEKSKINSSRDYLQATTLSDFSANAGAKNNGELSRHDSFAKFFLGPQSDGLDKGGIIDYVMDYCKRRASCRLSDASDIPTPPPPNRDSYGSSNSSKSTVRMTQRDSENSFACGEEKTVIHYPRGKDKIITASGKEDVQITPLIMKSDSKKSSRKNDSIETDESVMLADAGSTKEKILDVSDIGGIDGFEKFKKHLNPGRKNEDRYRKKIQNHTEFESKRLSVDERYSHPKLTPPAFSGPGSTTSLERPRKMMLCNSPPEKLTGGKHENAIDDNDKTPSPAAASATLPRNSAGQCHSTPLTNQSCITKLASMQRGLNLNHENLLKPEADICRANFDKQKRPKMTECETDSSGSSPCSSGLTGSFKTQVNLSEKLKIGCNSGSCEKDVYETKNNYNNTKTTKPSSLCTNPPRSVVVQTPSGAPSTDALAVVPIIQSALQQQNGSGPGNQACTCPHQCGQQQLQLNHGHAPGVGMPIVIHIHLPCPVTPTGLVAHPIPNSTKEGQM